MSISDIHLSNVMLSLIASYLRFCTLLFYLGALLLHSNPWYDDGSQGTGVSAKAALTSKHATRHHPVRCLYCSTSSNDNDDGDVSADRKWIASPMIQSRAEMFIQPYNSKIFSFTNKQWKRDFFRLKKNTSDTKSLHEFSAGPTLVGYKNNYGYGDEIEEYDDVDETEDDAREEIEEGITFDL